MDRILWTLACGIAVAAMADNAFAQRGRQPRASTLAELNCWMSDYREAKLIAEKSGDPMMIVFRCVP